MGLAAAALAGFGAWALASVAWGGLPDPAWTSFDEALIAAGALLSGSLLARVGCRDWTVAGVAAGLILQAAELLYRLQTGPAPPDWMLGRKVQGPVGYANAQGALLAVGLPLTLWLAQTRHAALRATAGAGAGVLCGALLLTQSRGALGVAVVAVIGQLALTRDVRTLANMLALAVYVGALWRPLQRVDRALVDGGSGVQTAAFRHYAAWILAGSLILALVAVTPLHVRAVRRAVLVGASAIVLVAGAAVLHAGVVDRAHGGFTGVLSKEDPANLPGGDTRLTSVSLTGRVKTWRVAALTFERHPALGAGTGQFARIWDRERDINNLSVLQPHSIELEALSELGIPGACLFGGFVALTFGALAGAIRRRSAAAAAAAAALAALMLQASVDWTFSFPALVVGVMLAVGAAAGTRTRARTGLLAHLIVTVATVGLFVSLAAPWLSARRAAAAERVLPSNVERAWGLAAAAERYNRWSAEVAALQARIAEEHGELVRAAALYAHAADLAQRPWSYEAERARVLEHVGLKAASRAACREARQESPLEPSLNEGVCAGA